MMPKQDWRVCCCICEGCLTGEISLTYLMPKEYFYLEAFLVLMHQLSVVLVAMWRREQERVPLENILSFCLLCCRILLPFVADIKLRDVNALLDR